VLGVSDVHAAVGLLSGGGALVMSTLCCLNPDDDTQFITVLFAMVSTALWTSLFALVLRGSTVTRLVGATALALVATSLVVGLIATLDL